MSFVDEVSIGFAVLAALGLALDWWDRRADARHRAEQPTLPPAE